MLVLTRQTNEVIMIADPIQITIVSAKGAKVRIGIAAPHNIPVHRKEVYLAIRQANIEAASVDREAADKLHALEDLIVKNRGNV